MIHDNTCYEFGGGILALGSTITLDNNTIVQNFSTAVTGNDSGAGIKVFPGSVVNGDNNIIYFNQSTTDPQVSGAPNLNYTCCATALSGTGNITDDPQFIYPAGDDFHLTAASPCIDAGNPSSPLDPDGTRADMGALYFDQSAPAISVSPDSLNFPETMVGSTDSLALTISNTGNADLIIYTITAGLPAVFSTGWDPIDSLVAPGGSLEVMVYFHPPDTQSYTDGLTIENNDVNLTAPLSGTGIPVSGINDRNPGSPMTYALYPPIPNPFNPSTVISFQLPAAGVVNLTVSDINGRVAAQLAGGWYQAGVHSVIFNGTGLASGVYFAKMRAGDFNRTCKMLLLK